MDLPRQVAGTMNAGAASSECCGHVLETRIRILERELGRGWGGQTFPVRGGDAEQSAAVVAGRSFRNRDAPVRAPTELTLKLNFLFLFSLSLIR